VVCPLAVILAMANMFPPVRLALLSYYTRNIRKKQDAKVFLSFKSSKIIASCAYLIRASGQFLIKKSDAGLDRIAFLIVRHCNCNGAG